MLEHILNHISPFFGRLDVSSTFHISGIGPTCSLWFQTRAQCVQN